jgi:type I restriction enzyme, R subunit
VALYKLTFVSCAPTPTWPTRWPKPATREPKPDQIKAEVDHYEKVREEVKLASGDYIDMKMYEPAMRHLLDTYIRAEESEKLSAFDDMTLVQLIVERGERRANHEAKLPRGDHRRSPATQNTSLLRG